MCFRAHVVLAGTHGTPGQISPATGNGSVWFVTATNYTGEQATLIFEVSLRSIILSLVLAFPCDFAISLTLRVASAIRRLLVSRSRSVVELS